MTNDTSTHQDHVIAHVIGSTVLGYFIWDESLYLLLDIGFIWRVYLDYEMGLLPGVVAIEELEADPELKLQLKADADLLLKGRTETKEIRVLPVQCLIDDVHLFVDNEGSGLIIAGEEGSLAVRASASTREISLTEWPGS